MFRAYIHYSQSIIYIKQQKWHNICIQNKTFVMLNKYYIFIYL